MPGTILVSVLELVDIPFSPVSIKVSMGNKEYQAWDKGEFSFPLTTLRGDLVVVIQDSEGNEISHESVETKLIVEKGIWDEIFPLEGGGYVKMRLQFVLNDDERNRIRLMRESAMRKKHDELLDSRNSSAEVASSLCHEDSGSISLSQQNKKINDADENKEGTSRASTLSQNVDHVNLSRLSNRQSDERVEAQSLSAKIATREVYSREVYSKESPSAMGRSDSGSYSGKRSSLEKIPSSVRNMISAFESNLSQDVKSHIKPSSPTKQLLKKTGSRLEEPKTDNMTTMRGSARLEELSTTKVKRKGTNNISPKSKLKSTDKDRDIEEEKSHGDSTRTTTIKTSSAAENVSDNPHSGGGSVLEESRTKVSQENSRSLTSTHNLRSVEHYVDMHDSFDSFAAWIFPDQMRRFCITTGGKKLMDFLESHGIKSEACRQRKIDFSIPEKSNVNVGAGSEMNRSKKTQKARKSKPESEGVESSAGPVGQAVKVAIMVGFGVLVLFTRQRNNR